jgi:hypothetical protein
MVAEMMPVMALTAVPEIIKGLPLEILAMIRRIQ